MHDMWDTLNCRKIALHYNKREFVKRPNGKWNDPSPWYTTKIVKSPTPFILLFLCIEHLFFFWGGDSIISLPSLFFFCVFTPHPFFFPFSGLIIRKHWQNVMKYNQGSQICQAQFQNLDKFLLTQLALHLIKPHPQL